MEDLKQEYGAQHQNGNTNSAEDASLFKLQGATLTREQKKVLHCQIMI